MLLCVNFQHILIMGVDKNCIDTSYLQLLGGTMVKRQADCVNILAKNSGKIQLGVVYSCCQS